MKPGMTDVEKKFENCSCSDSALGIALEKHVNKSWKCILNPKTNICQKQFVTCSNLLTIF